jgi:hypothetical protein
MEDLEAAKEAAEMEYRSRSANDFTLFYKGLVIPSAYGPKLLGLCLADFQEEAFNSLAPSLRAVRDGTMPPRRRFWLERTKKASKDADLAICILWLMAFPKRPVLVQVSAANQQQAGIIKRRAADILHYNPWLADRVRITRYGIVGFGGLGEVIIEATGSSGAKQGDTPALLILNELVHVDKWDVNQTHMNNADGVPQGVVIISTNAGIKGSHAEKWKKNAINNQDRWTILSFKGVAPWVNKKDVEDARRRDPVGSEHDRLWGGLWTSGVGDAVEEAAIDACFVLPGPLEKPEDGWRYVAGLDLGISHDHAGIVVVGASQKLQMMKVARVFGYRPDFLNPSTGKLEVNFTTVQESCLQLSKHYRVSWFGFDPAAGGSFMAQQLRAKGVPMHDMSFSSKKNTTTMALSFIQSLKARKLQCYEDEEGRLRRDFGKFQIVTDITKIPTKHVLKAVSDEWGHADVGTALLICLPKAIQLAGISGFFDSDSVLFEDLTEEAKEETIATMSEGMQEIITAYDNLPRRRTQTFGNDW